MAPTRTGRTRRSSTEEVVAMNAPQIKTVSIQSPVKTPVRSPSKGSVTITQGQKQALIDNLQLEITERARKLRAQYALQAQSLHTRIELRVNRIPTALRKENMGVLYEKYLEATESNKASKSKEPPQTESTFPKGTASDTELSIPKKTAGDPFPARGKKRLSSDLEDDNKSNNKENTPDPSHTLNPKKRSKPNAPTRSNISTVLSPKSSNSRNIPKNPTKSDLSSQQKTSTGANPHLRAQSPLKPSTQITMPMPPPLSPAKAAALAITTSIAVPTEKTKPRSTRTRAGGAKTTKAAAETENKPPLKAKAPAVTRPKRGAPTPVLAMASESRTASAASNTSNATTVVKRAAAGTGTRGKASGGLKAVGKRIMAPPVEAPAQARRVLRKRN